MTDREIEFINRLYRVIGALRILAVPSFSSP